MRPYRCGRCDSRLFDAKGLRGKIAIRCRKCKYVSEFLNGQLSNPVVPTIVERPTPEQQVALMEERWRLSRRKRAEMATGLRFDVFRRDDFRCRYCGRGINQGVLLEVDHVVPQSRGGDDSMDNLVTACWQCNNGKRDKVLLTIPQA